MKLTPESSLLVQREPSGPHLGRIVWEDYDLEGEAGPAFLPFGAELLSKADVATIHRALEQIKTRADFERLTQPPPTPPRLERVK